MKVKLTISRTVVETATIEVDVTADAAKVLQQDARKRETWALYELAPQAQNWKRSGLADYELRDVTFNELSLVGSD